MYFAPGATHTPHHVPKQWADRYKGRFDSGWDALREQTFARQKELGVIAPDAELTARPDEIPAWEDTDEQRRPVLARQIENYAGFLEFADHHVGRLIDALAELDILDDTVVYYIIGDNGASAEGTVVGTFNAMTGPNGGSDLESVDFVREHIDEIGGPSSYPHYAVGWAHALCTPYQWTKQVASHWGGTRNATIVHCPNRIAARGELRHQFSHVIDVAPTILELAGLPAPSQVHGVTQKPMEGSSMAYSFDDAAAGERHDTQYFEMFCNRGIYHKGWSAVTKHRTPWNFGHIEISFDDDVWELYDGSSDWTQAHDLSARAARQAARAPTTLSHRGRPPQRPPARRPPGRTHAARGRRATDPRPRHLADALSGMGALNENCVLNLKNKSHQVTAEIVVPDGGADGVLINQGGITGGWSLYLNDGKPTYTAASAAASSPPPPRRHR